MYTVVNTRMLEMSNDGQGIKDPKNLRKDIVLFLGRGIGAAGGSVK